MQETQTVTLTQEQLQALVQEQVALAIKAMPKAKGYVPSFTHMAKPTEKGGLYVMDVRAKAYSEKLNKEYAASINFHKHQIELIHLICKDKALRDTISQAIETGKEVRK